MIPAKLAFQRACCYYLHMAKQKRNRNVIAISLILFGLAWLAACANPTSDLAVHAPIENTCGLGVELGNVPYSDWNFNGSGYTLLLNQSDRDQYLAAAASLVPPCAATPAAALMTVDFSANAVVVFLAKGQCLDGFTYQDACAENGKMLMKLTTRQTCCGNVPVFDICRAYAVRIPKTTLPTEISNQFIPYSGPPCM